MYCTLEAVLDEFGPPAPVVPVVPFGPCELGPRGQLTVYAPNRRSWLVDRRDLGPFSDCSACFLSHLNNTLIYERTPVALHDTKGYV